MNEYVSYTEKEIFDDKFHVLVFNMIASCVNSPSDHRIIIEQDDHNERYYMVDFQDDKGSNTEFNGKGWCASISHSTVWEDDKTDPDSMYQGTYDNLYSLLDAVLSICDRGIYEIYTEGY